MVEYGEAQGGFWKRVVAKRTSSDILLNNKADSGKVDDEDRDGGNVLKDWDLCLCLCFGKRQTRARNRNSIPDEERRDSNTGERQRGYRRARKSAGKT